MISTGTYTIANVNGAHIGRFYIEDLSLHPKRIVGAPVSKLQNDGKWNIVVDDNTGSVTLHAVGSKTGALDDKKVYAFLMETEVPLTWTLYEVPYEADTYAILRDVADAWTLESDEPETQVSVSFFNGKRLIPPPEQQFKIVAVKA